MHRRPTPARQRHTSAPPPMARPCRMRSRIRREGATQPAVYGPVSNVGRQLRGQGRKQQASACHLAWCLPLACRAAAALASCGVPPHTALLLHACLHPPNERSGPCGWCSGAGVGGVRYTGRRASACRAHAARWTSGRVAPKLRSIAITHPPSQPTHPPSQPTHPPLQPPTLAAHPPSQLTHPPSG